MYSILRSREYLHGSYEYIKIFIGIYIEEPIKHLYGK
jgi:hypothetical protein